MEVWQFKYQNKYDLKPLKQKAIKSDRNKPYPKYGTHLTIASDSTPTNALYTNNSSDTPSDSEYNSEWFNDKTPTIKYEGDDNMDTAVLKMKILSNSISELHSQYRQRESECMSTDYKVLMGFMESLPWCSLPLAASIASNEDNKWEQCYSIWCKYLQENSNDAINIAYLSRNAMNIKYDELIQYKEWRQDPNNEMLNQPDNIENDIEFDKKLLQLFDSCLNDVIHNLRDSLTRFVQTDQFKLAK